jgi:hypothetical protein
MSLAFCVLALCFVLLRVPCFAGGAKGKPDQPAVAEALGEAWRNARRLAVLVIGGSIVLFGLALLLLPGPAFVVIPTGLAILATEFVWARRLLRKARDKGAELGAAMFAEDKGQQEDASSDRQ